MALTCLVRWATRPSSRPGVLAASERDCLTAASILRAGLMGRVEFVDGDLLAEALGKRRQWMAYIGLVGHLP